MDEIRWEESSGVIFAVVFEKYAMTPP